MRYLGLVALVCAASCCALLPSADAQQGVVVPPPNLSNYATKSDIPKPESAIPPMETPAGYPGTAGTYRPGNAVQPRVTRSKTVVLGATGTATFDWSAQGGLNTPVQVATTAIYTGTGVPKCWVTDTSSTAVTVKCVIENNTLLNLAAVTAGINLNGMSAAGMSVGVIVLPPS